MLLDYNSGKVLITVMKNDDVHPLHAGTYSYINIHTNKHTHTGPVKSVCVKRGRQSMGMTCFGPCRLWALIVTWSPFSCTCRSTGTQRYVIDVCMTV